MRKTNFILICLLLAGCASRYGKNRPLFNTTGYTDEQINSNTYHLKYRSNAYTSLEQTKIYWDKRAQELCGELKVEAIHDEEMVREIYTLRSNGYYPHSFQVNFPQVIGIVKCVEKEK